MTSTPEREKAARPFGRTALFVSHCFGGGGNRTRVPKPLGVSFYARSPLFGSRPLVSSRAGSSGTSLGGSRPFAPRRREGTSPHYGRLIVPHGQRRRGRCR